MQSQFGRCLSVCANSAGKQRCLLAMVMVTVRPQFTDMTWRRAEQAGAGAGEKTLADCTAFVKQMEGKPALDLESKIIEAFKVRLLPAQHDCVRCSSRLSASCSAAALNAPTHAPVSLPGAVADATIDRCPMKIADLRHENTPRGVAMCILSHSAPITRRARVRTAMCRSLTRTTTALSQQRT